MAESVCVCACTHACTCLLKQKIQLLILALSKKCRECEVLAMFSGRAMPILDVNPRCTEQLGTARWPYSTCFTFLRGSEGTNGSRQRRSPTGRDIGPKATVILQSHKPREFSMFSRGLSTMNKVMQ